MEKKREIIEKEIKRLDNFLKTKPDRGVYTGDGDNGGEWVDMENRQNDEIEEGVKRQIVKLKRLLSKLNKE